MATEDNALKIPRHVSIIMDGNGRWAKERGKERIFGHFEGVESVRAVTEASIDLGVKYLSLFAFSEENWSRPEQEVSGLMKLMMKSMLGEFDTFMKNGVRFVVLGNRERLSRTINDTIDEMMEKTRSNDALTMIVFLSYSGKWDLLQAMRTLAATKKPEEITMEDVDAALVTAGFPDPDLIIRTSGEKRLSNYLLWQAAYTEFVFTDTLWPDFRKESLVAAVEEYSRRDRRFGKVK